MTGLRSLLVSNLDAPFVRNDIPILEELGSVRFLRYRGRRDLPRLMLALTRADVVVCWFVLGYAFTSVALGRILGTPTVLVAGGWDVAMVPEIGYGAMLSPRRARLTQYALRRATRVLSVSHALATEVARWVDREVSVVPLGVDTAHFRPGDRKSRQVVTVGGIDNEVRYRRKGIEVLFAAASRLPTIPFLLVGANAPEWQRHLESSAPPNVRVLGRLDEEALLNRYQHSSVYAQLSAYESFGLALAEAMACGCVPVVSSRGAMPEVVGDAGQVVPFADIDATVRAIEAALSDSAGGARARERMLSHYSLDARRELLQGEIRAVT